ncbi:MAG: thioredoxin [Bacteroidales bacterium]|jgi:thioredoxin 1|nr:thioredoxin [Bacteroidales bacterium]
MAVEITDSNWESLVSGDKPVVMDFWAEWCGPCRMISPIVEEVAQEYQDKVVVGKINIDDNANITQQFGIRNIPTLLFFKGGELADKHVGAIRKAELTEKINNLL